MSSNVRGFSLRLTQADLFAHVRIVTTCIQCMTVGQEIEVHNIVSGASVGSLVVQLGQPAAVTHALPLHTMTSSKSFLLKRGKIGGACNLIEMYTHGPNHLRS